MVNRAIRTDELQMCNGDLWSRNGNPLQYYCLENLMDRGSWQVTVHGVANSQTGLKRLSMQAQWDLWGEEIMVCINKEFMKWTVSH